MPLRPAQRWLSKENNKLQTNQDYIVKPYQEGGGGKGEENKEREIKARKDKREEKEVKGNRKR